MPHDLKLKKFRLASFNSTCTSTGKKTSVSFESKKTPEVNLNRKIQHFTVYLREQGGNLLCLAKYPAQLVQTQNQIGLIKSSYVYNFMLMNLKIISVHQQELSCVYINSK